MIKVLESSFILSSENGKPLISTDRLFLMIDSSFINAINILKLNANSLANKYFIHDLDFKFGVFKKLVSVEPNNKKFNQFTLGNGGVTLFADFNIYLNLNKESLEAILTFYHTAEHAYAPAFVIKAVYYFNGGMELSMDSDDSDSDTNDAADVDVNRNKLKYSSSIKNIENTEF